MEDDSNIILSKLGDGIINPVAYETAIVAWIPKLNDISKPEFPQCLQWLRDNQLSDGSWGTESPTLSHCNIVSTLAAIIAFKKWNDNENDLNYIESGETALNFLVKLIKFETSKTLGYDLILPTLLTQAKQLDLNVPFDDLDVTEISELKIKSIRKHQSMFGWKRKHVFWVSLELIGGLRESVDKILFELNDNLLESNGSVSGSPSASAFYLLTRRLEHSLDEPRVYEYLRDLVKLNNGGVPSISPYDNFEMAWSMSELVMAGFDMQQLGVRNCLDKMISNWNKLNGFIGASSYMVADADDICVFIYVLNSTNNYKYIKNSLDVLMTFFNGEFFTCYAGERNASISTNINALIALKSYTIDDPRIEPMIASLVDWLKSNISDKEFIFVDKWHLSPYYPTSRAVYAFQDIDDCLAQKFVETLIKHQNSDKGWGVAGSTIEETAMVTVALCNWYRNKNKMDVTILKSIRQFFNSFNGKKYAEIWIAKSLLCSRYYVDTLEISAEHALKNILFTPNK